MKTPWVLSAQFREMGTSASVVPSHVRNGIVHESGDVPAGVVDGTKEASKLASLLKSLKLTEEEISRVTELVATIAAVASVVGWVVAAISTIKQVLTFVGILGTAKDPVTTALEAIGKKLETIYGYLAATAKKGLYVEAIEYRSTLNQIRNDIANLALSRSEVAMNTVTGHVDLLQKAIEKMLSPANAEIPFFRGAYGYTGRTAPVATHWIDMAVPFYLRRTDALRSGVNYWESSQDLSATIWDPGHYLDLLIPAIALRLAALEGTEPAFRSTGWERHDLITIYKGLQDFITKWNASHFVSTVVGPIDPEPHPSGGHFIFPNPVTGVGFSSPSIALCCVDPVSGLSMLETEFSEGFAVREISDPSGVGSPYWVVDNYEQAIASAYARQSAMMSEIRTRSGINRFYELMHSVYALISGPSRSEFVDISDAKFASRQLQKLGATEYLDLGIIGGFAGVQGKKYSAQRYRQEVVKKFRFAIARRTDASRIQLGYRIRVSVGGGVSGQADLVLCPFSKLNSPLQVVDIFPSGIRSIAVKAPQAIVYDVIQTVVFSAAEEDSFEKSGSVPNTGKFNRRAQKRRIFVNPRASSVQFHVKVTFEFDVNDDEHPFFGFANVEVSTGEEGTPAGAFVADIEVFETLPPFDATSNDPPREQLADSATLHLAAEFLDTTGDYFIDRDAGYAEMEARFAKTSERYAKSAQVGVLDPRGSVTRRAHVEKSIAEFAEAELLANPKGMRALLAELNVREASIGNDPQR